MRGDELLSSPFLVVIFCEADIPLNGQQRLQFPASPIFVVLQLWSDDDHVVIRLIFPDEFGNGRERDVHFAASGKGTEQTVAVHDVLSHVIQVLLPPNIGGLGVDLDDGNGVLMLQSVLDALSILPLLPIPIVDDHDGDPLGDRVDDLLAAQSLRLFVEFDVRVEFEHSLVLFAAAPMVIVCAVRDGLDMLVAVVIADGLGKGALTGSWESTEDDQSFRGSKLC